MGWCPSAQPVCSQQTRYQLIMCTVGSSTAALELCTIWCQPRYSFAPERKACISQSPQSKWLHFWEWAEHSRVSNPDAPIQLCAVRGSQLESSAWFHGSPQPWMAVKCFLLIGLGQYHRKGRLHWCWSCLQRLLWLWSRLGAGPARAPPSP